MKVSSAAGNAVLLSATQFPGSRELDDGLYGLLVTDRARVWEFTLPLTLSVDFTENHRVLLKPGYYPTTTMVISELFESFQMTEGTIEPDIQFAHTWSSTDPGWSVYKEPRGRWVLYFRSTKNLRILFSREPGGNDILHQLGLRGSTARNWAAQAKFDPAENIFLMQQIATPNQTDATDNTIVSRSELNVPYMYELQFEQINLTPRRYVDIIIENIPGSSITNGARHSNTLARVDFSSHRVSYTSSVSNAVTSNEADSFDEGSTADTYVMFERAHDDYVTFDPLSLDHLKVRLVDSMGMSYTAARDHTMEIKMLMLADATVPFEVPIHSVGSVMAMRRGLSELPEFSEFADDAGDLTPTLTKTRRRRKSVVPATVEPATTELATPSPLAEWIFDNKVEVGATATTFFGMLYFSYRMGFLGGGSAPTTHSWARPS